MFKRWILIAASTFLCIGLLGVAAVGIAAAFAYPQLPELSSLTEYKPRIPLRVYTADGVLIGEYGEERRTFVAIDKVPDKLKNAIISAEDVRFFEHNGVDLKGLVRAAVSNFLGRGGQQGASTLTMQVARNFYLSSDKNYTRKFYEILLSYKIEKNLTKNQILEVYINQIFLGRHSYGFAVAAQTYYGKTLDQLTEAEAAMLAGLPKAPSKYNPFVNPQRAQQRQRYILARMKEFNYIDQATYDKALAEPIRPEQVKGVQNNKEQISLHAEYAAEMARQLAVDQFKEEAYTRGIKVTTTINSEDQRAAYEALRKGVLDYERRHAYRGAEAYVDLSGVESDSDDALEDLIAPYMDQDELKSAIVLAASPKEIKAYTRGGDVVTLDANGVKFGASMLAANAPSQKQIRRGAVIRVLNTAKGWVITQTPEVEGAFVSLDPKTGEIKALVGGFDFNRSKFNHVTQAWRQAGSSFKPFIYSAALEKGFSPSSVLDDAPVTYSAGQTGSQAWQPQNYDHRYDGPMTLRTALMKSKNVVAVRLIQAIGAPYAQDYVTTRFGFDKAKQPPYLTMALGAGSVTPWQMANAYSVFANGGYRIQPFVVKEMRDDRDNIIARVDPPVVGDNAAQVLDPRNAFMMDSMMKDVARRGTGARAYAALKRPDIAGKTGTTNDFFDGWFCGYQPSLVAVAWMGFDQPQKLGSGETGGALALPIWIDYMSKALAKIPVETPTPPPGLISAGDSEYVYKEFPRVKSLLPAPAAPPAPEDSSSSLWQGGRGWTETEPANPGR